MQGCTTSTSITLFVVRTVRGLAYTPAQILRFGNAVRTSNGKMLTNGYLHISRSFRCMKPMKTVNRLRNSPCMYMHIRNKYTCKHIRKSIKEIEPGCPLLRYVEVEVGKSFISFVTRADPRKDSRGVTEAPLCFV